jgi:hypothetical protein
VKVGDLVHWLDSVELEKGLGMVIKIVRKPKITDCGFYSEYHILSDEPDIRAFLDYELKALSEAS